MRSSRGSQQTDSTAESSFTANEDSALHARFETWVDEHSTALIRFASRMTGQMSSAEDLVQETFQQAWQGMHRLRDPDAAAAWLFQILRTRYARWVRAQRRIPQVSLDQLAVDVERFEAVDDRERLSIHDELQVALRQLEDRFKEPLLLVVLEELPVAQVARILRLRRGTVLSRVHRAKKKLARIIEAMRANSAESNTCAVRQQEKTATAENVARGKHARSI